MRRIIHWRRALLLSVGAILFLGGIAILHHLQVGRSAGLFLTSAEEALEEEDFAQALHSYRLYLRLVPDAVEIRSKMGRLLADGGSYDRAFGTLEEVVRQNPSDEAARERLVEVSLALGRFADAEAHLLRMLDISNVQAGLTESFSADQAEHLFLLGQTKQATGDPRLAASLYARALTLDPQLLDAYAWLGNLLQNELERPLPDEPFAAVAGSVEQQVPDSEDEENSSESNTDGPLGLTAEQQAQIVMRRLVEENPDSPQAHIYRGNFLVQVGSVEARDAAAAEAETAIRLDPEDAGAYLLAANCDLSRRRIESAREHAEHGRSLAPEMAQWYLLLAQIEVLSRRPDAALQWIREGVHEVDQKRDELLAQLANMLLDRGEVAEARQVVTELVHYDSARDWTEYLTGRILLAEGEWMAASQQFEVARPYFLDRPELLKQIDFRIGVCHRHLGDTDQQLIAYRRATEIDPLWIQPRLAMAKAHLANGLQREALRELRQLVQLVGQDGIPADTLLDLVRLTSAESRAGGTGDWREAEQWLAAASERLPDSPQLPIAQAELYLSQDKIPAAVSALEEGIERFPQETKLRGTLAEVLVNVEDWEGVERVLKQAEEDFGDSVTLRLAQANYLAARYGEQASDQLRELATSSDEFSKADFSRLIYGLAVHATRINDLDHAIELATELGEREPDNLKTWLLRLDLAQRAPDKADIGPVLEALDRIQRRGVYWHYARAVDYYRRAAEDPELLDQALSHLDEARRQRPGWASLALLSGKIRLLKGEVEAGLDHFVRAIELAPQSPADLQRTVQLLFETHQYREADRIIKLVESRDQQIPSELGKVASQISVLMGEFDQALDLATEMAAESSDYSKHIWHGKLAAFRARQLATLEKQAESERLYEEGAVALRKALELAPETPEPWVLLIQLLDEAGDRESAEAVAAEMQQNLSEEAFLLASAQAKELFREWEEAEQRFLRAAAGGDPNILRAVASFFRRRSARAESAAERESMRQQAEKHLTQLMAAPDAENGHAIWARRQLAEISLARGEFVHLQAAEEWIAENLAAVPGSLPDLRLKAITLSRIRKRHREAARLWEEVVAESPRPLPSDLFSLAQIYQALGEGDRAAETLLDLVRTSQRHPNYGRYLTAYIETLLRKSELGEAETWLGILRRTSIGEPVVARLQAEIHLRREQDREAISELTSLLDRVTDEAPAEFRGELAEQISVWLDELGLLAGQLAAEDGGTPAADRTQAYVDAAASLAPAGELALAAHLARQGRFDEALDLSDSVEDRTEIEARRDIAIAIAESRRASTEQLERAGKLLESTLELDPKNHQTVMALARLRDLQGRLEDAADRYREAIRLKSDNVVAMNNLAMVLVGQNKNLDEAEQHLKRAIEIAGRIPALLDSQALLELAQGRPQMALSLLQEAVTGLPTPEVYFHQAVAYHRLGQAPRARAALQGAAGLQVERLTTLERKMHRELVEQLN